MALSASFKCKCLTPLRFKGLNDKAAYWGTC